MWPAPARARRPRDPGRGGTPATTSAVCSTGVGRAERAQRLRQWSDGRGVPLENRVTSASSSASAAPADGAGKDARAASATSPRPGRCRGAGEHRRRECLEVSLAGHRGVEGSQPLGCREQQRRRVGARWPANTISARDRSSRARWSSSTGPSSATASSSDADTASATSSFACAASSERSTRPAGSGVSSAARCRNAAAAASPPRACARPAERASSAAMASSGDEVACARCQARRSDRAPGRSPWPARYVRRGGHLETPRGRSPIGPADG